MRAITIIHAVVQNILRSASQWVIASLAQTCKYNAGVILPRSLLKMVSVSCLRRISWVYFLMVSSKSACRHILVWHLDTFIAFELLRLTRIHAPLRIGRFRSVADNLLWSQFVVLRLFFDVTRQHAWHWMLLFWPLLPLWNLNVPASILMNIWWRCKVWPWTKSYSSRRIKPLLLLLLPWLGSLRSLISIHSSKRAIWLLRHVHHLKLGSLWEHEALLLRFGRS